MSSKYKESFKEYLAILLCGIIMVLPTVLDSWSRQMCGHDVDTDAQIVITHIVWPTLAIQVTCITKGTWRTRQGPDPPKSHLCTI